MNVALCGAYRMLTWCWGPPSYDEGLRGPLWVVDGLKPAGFC